MAEPINIIGGFYKDDALSWSCQDTVNYLPAAAEASGTKTPTMLRTPPGLKPWLNIGDGPEFAIRGMHDAEGRLFVVAGTKMYQISNKGVAIPLGTVPGRGRVSIAHNQIAGGNEVLVVNGNSGYVWNTLRQTFTRITDPGYPGAFQAVFADGYILQVEPFGRYVFHSNLADALDYNTLDRFEAESEPDKIVAIVVSNDEVRVLGERTSQVFNNTGAAQGTFQSKGVTINRGCAGRWTALAMDNGIFFLGDDGVIYRDDGYNPVRISTYAIEQAIADNDWSKAFAFQWSSRGHSVYYLTFPDGQTWGYDVSSGAWHRRASYHPAYEVSRRWRLSHLAYSNGRWIGGDSTSGKLYLLDWDYILEDVDSELVSERVSQVTYNAGRRFSVDLVELEVRTGELATVPGEFIVQPEGPSISGDAPNGTIGFAYPGYTYTVTAGDAAVANISIKSGALPEGLVFNSATGSIEAGSALKGGQFTITVRVTDENGLWAEVVDTITISSVFFLLFGTGTEGVWISPDTDTWSPKYNFVPSVGNRVYNAEATQGKLAIDVMSVTTSWTEHFVQAPMPPWDTFVPVVDVISPYTEVALLPHAMHDFGGILVAWERNGNRPVYWVSSDGGADYEEIASPNNWRLRGIGRLQNGRWIAYFSLGGTRGFFYTDEETPRNWVPAPLPVGVGSNSTNDCIGSGRYGYFIDNLRRVYRTQNGESWVQVGNLVGGPSSGSPFVTSTGAVLIYGSNASGKILVSHDDGQTFVEITFAPSGDIIKVTEAGGYIIGSRDSASFVISITDGDSWIEKTVPFSGYGTAATVIAVDASEG